MASKGRRERKTARYAALLAALEAEGKRLYHNATLSWPYNEIPDGMDEVAWGAWYLSVEDELYNLNMNMYDPAWIDGRIALRYGKVYTWGRGGRTCAPEDWIRQNGGSSFNVKGPGDLMEGRGRAEGWRLLVDMRAWNEYVKDFCSEENIFEVIRGPIDEAVGRKRQAALELARMLTI